MKNNARLILKITIAAFFFNSLFLPMAYAQEVGSQKSILGSTFCKSLSNASATSASDEKLMMNEVICRKAAIELLKIEINNKLRSFSNVHQFMEISIPLSYAVMMIGASMTTGKLIYQTYKSRSLMAGMESLITQTSGKVYLSIAGGGLITMVGQKLILKLNESQLNKLQNELEHTKDILSQIQKALSASMDDDIILTPKSDS